MADLLITHFRSVHYNNVCVTAKQISKGCSEHQKSKNQESREWREIHNKEFLSNSVLFNN
jgi:hypothetical protein